MTRLYQSFSGRPVTYNGETCDRTTESNEVQGRLYFSLPEDLYQKILSGQARIEPHIQEVTADDRGRDLQLEAIEIFDI